MAKFDQSKYINGFIAEKYDRINLTIPKGQKDVIKAHAERLDHGSVNAFIQRAISETIRRDVLGDPENPS